MSKLSNFLQENSESRKIFGKKEIEIIKKHLLGIKLTQSEKNRLSRDIRPKFRVIRHLSEFQDEFELKKNSDNLNLVKNTLEAILKDNLKDRINSVFLFGSHANNTATPRSDIDICVVFSKINLEEATRFRIRVSGELPQKIDIQVFNILPQKIKREIARNHRLLYKSQEFDNLSFSIKYQKDEDYFIRKKKIFGE